MVVINTLKRIPTTGGDVLHGMKSTDFGFHGFGEAYFSCVDQFAIKGWKMHNQMTMNLIVPVGNVRFVFIVYHENGKRSFLEETIGESRYVRLTVQPKTWFAFQGLSTGVNLVVNIANIPHHPGEAERLELDEVAFNWESF